MLEILKSFEQVASRVNTSVLVIPGRVILAMGLLLWVAGWARTRLWLGLVAAVTGGLAGFFASGQNPAVAGLAAGGSAAVGAIVPRLVAAVLLAVVGGTIAFAIVARAYLFPQQGFLHRGQDLDPPARRFTVQESLDAVQAYVLTVGDRVEASVDGLVSTDLLIVAATGVGLLAVGLIFERLGGALTCSTVGSGLVFAGLTFLLIFKGSTPVTRMEQQGPFYGLVLLGMVAFGTLEQLLLCPQVTGRRNASSGPGRTREEESKHGWRNR